MPTNRIQALNPADPETLPWWRFGMVWLVIGGPALVVVAAIATAVIAVRGADPVVRDAQAPGVPDQAQAQSPAVQARNHAATPSR